MRRSRCSAQSWLEIDDAISSPEIQSPFAMAVYILKFPVALLVFIAALVITTMMLQSVPAVHFGMIKARNPSGPPSMRSAGTVDFAAVPLASQDSHLSQGGSQTSDPFTTPVLEM